jgi:hypothetical protein
MKVTLQRTILFSSLFIGAKLATGVNAKLRFRQGAATNGEGRKLNGASMTTAAVVEPKLTSYNAESTTGGQAKVLTKGYGVTSLSKSKSSKSGTTSAFSSKASKSKSKGIDEIGSAGSSKSKSSKSTTTSVSVNADCVDCCVWFTFATYCLNCTMIYID